MADYEAISKAVSNAVKREVDKQIKAAYEHGYQRGYSEEYEARQSAVDIAYKRGLNDAWKCARKIVEMGEYDLKWNVFTRCGDGEYPFAKYTASEAIAKIKEYEEKQAEKQTKYVCNTCKHGEGEGCDSPIYCDDNNSGYEPKQTNSYRNNKYYNTFPTSKETADEIKAEYDEETRSYIYTAEGEE